MQNSRVMHYIKPNAHLEMPKHILIVDTEAWIRNIPLENEEKYNRKLQTLRLGVCTYLRYEPAKKLWYEKTFDFYTKEQFGEILFNKILRDKTKLYVFAHNMAYDYALLGFDTLLSENNFDIKLRAIDSIFLIKAYNSQKNQSLNLISTTNYYQKSLEALGEIFGESKSKDKPEFDDENSPRYINNLDTKTVLEYCIQDVKVLTKVVKEHILFIQNNNLGNFKPTIASQAFNAFRHRFMKENILVHTYKEILEMEIASYRGGRCEAYLIGEAENIYKLDINSMYPFIMLNKKFPVKPLSKEPLLDIDIGSIEHSIKSGTFVLANCDISLNEPFLACKRDKLLFPVGRIKETITSPEIEYILDNPKVGKINKINKAVGYLMKDIFSDYVNFFYNIRTNSPNPAIEAMAKLFLNSLYGKFAQKASNDLVLNDDIKLKNDIFSIMTEQKTFVIESLEPGFDNYIRLGDNLYKTKPGKDFLSSDSCPIISSAVTGYARTYLYEMGKIANWDNVLYCDTDSLFVNEIGYNNLQKSKCISPKELGKFKLEEKGNIIIFGAKNYTFNEETKIKGIKKNAKNLGENKYLQYQFTTKNKRYRNATPDGKIILEPIIKELSLKYDKGTVLSNGKVEPLKVKEW